MALNKEKDANSNAIFEKVRAIREKRQEERNKYSKEMGELRESVAAPNLSRDDQRLIAQAAPLSDKLATIDKTYDASLDTLQQLYHLNGKRYNDLLRLHSAREALEESHYRELRDIAAERVRFQGQAERAGMTDVEKREAALRIDGVKGMEQEADGRYQNVLAALEEYQALVNSQIKTQKDYLTEHEAIAAEMLKHGSTPAEQAALAEKLSQLNARKNAEETGYQSKVRYIQEKLGMQEQRNREMSRLADDRREVEMAWARTEEELKAQRLPLVKERAAEGIAQSIRTGIDEKITAIDDRIAQEKKTYNAAVKNIEDRRSLTEKAMNDRLAYLKERNDIRVRMAGSARDADSMEKFRNEISKLEEKRITGEQSIRGQLLSLADSMPAAYRLASGRGDGLDRRAERWNRRFDMMRRNLDARWEKEKAGFDEELKVLDQRLSAANLSDADRQTVQQARAAAATRLDEAEKLHQREIASLDGRNKSEQQRLTARAKYIAERNELKKNMRLKSANYDDVRRYDSELRNLDAKWDEQERNYRNESSSFAMPIAADTPEGSVRERFTNAWEQGIRNIETKKPVEAGVKTDRVDTPDRNQNRTAEYRDDARQENGLIQDARDTYKTVRDAVAETYHDAVHYLTD